MGMYVPLYRRVFGEEYINVYTREAAICPSDNKPVDGLCYNPKDRRQHI